MAIEIATAVVATSRGPATVTDSTYQIRYYSFSSTRFTQYSRGEIMVSYPHTHLFHGERKTVAISGPHIQVLDSEYVTGTPFVDLS
jgi:hypothetical protein